MNIADRIQNLRKSRGISQEELADLIGVSRQAVSKWESEQSVPDIEKIILLSEYFGTTTDYLLKGIEPAKEGRTGSRAVLFAIVGTGVNIIGLIAAITVWIVRQEAYAVGIGLILMTIGVLIFLAGQINGGRDKEKAKKKFILANIWILPFIPVSCCFNILDGLAGGYSGIIAPMPLLGNSLLTWGLLFVIYVAACFLISCIVKRKMH